MSSPESARVFVRNDKGQLWGPIAPESLELMLENRMIEGRIQLSWDGINFAFPSRFPELREFIPDEHWKGSPGDAAAAPAVRAPGAGAVPSGGPGAVPIAGPGAVPKPGPGAVPIAGPGAIPKAGPGAMPTAGPGTRQPVAAEVRAPQAAAPTPPAPASSSTGSAPANADPIPEAGDLAKISGVRLYYLAAAHGLTGLMKLRTHDREIELHFRRGNPEHLASTHPDDAISGFLLREKLATEAQVSAAQAVLAQYGGDLIAALFGTGALNPSTAFTHLAQRAQGILLRALIAESGTFEWRRQELPPSKAMPLGNRWAVLMDLVRRIPVGEVRRRVGEAADHSIMKSGGEVPVSDLRLTPQETRAIGFIDGVRSLNQLARDLPQDADTFFRLAWVLRELDVVAFSAAKVGRTEDTTAKPAPAQAAGNPPPPSPPEPPRPAAPPDARAAAVGPAGAPQPGPGAEATRGSAPGPAVGAVPRAGPIPASPPPSPRPAGPAASAAAGPSASAAAPGSSAPAGGAARTGVPQAGPGTAAPRAAPSNARPAATAAGSAKPAADAAAGDGIHRRRTATAPSTPAEHEAELKTLREVAAKLKDKNKFELLDLTDKADSSAVKIAYFKLARQFHPDTVPPDAPPEMGQLKADIFAAIGDAYRTLGDDRSRAEYIEELKAGGAADVDVLAILHAEELFQKGCILVKAKKFPQAVEMLTDAIATNADEGEFYAWRGIARFYASADRKQGQQEAERDFQLALKKNPRCAQAYFFHGQVNRIIGDGKKALTLLEKVLELQPDHIDAQREIRFLKK